MPTPRATDEDYFNFLLAFQGRHTAEAARGLKNEENPSWVTKQSKKALDPKDRDTVEV